MPKARPPYPAAFRQQMVEPVRSGRTPEDLAREFEPSAQTIRTRVAQADRDAGERTDGLRTEERDEMRRENRRLREERDDPRRGPLRTAEFGVAAAPAGRGPQHGLKCAMR